MLCDDLDFILAPNAKIAVQGSGVTFTAINNTHFYGCYSAEMWYGIQVLNSGAIDFSSGTKVEDAWIGLTIFNSANITACRISQTYFHDNMTGIYLLGPGKFRLGAFSGNEIKRSGTILPPPSGFSYSGSQLHRGILLLNATVDLSSNAPVRNTIQGYRYGIYALLSNLTISNCTFQNNVNDASLPQDTLDGTDIYAYQSLVTASGKYNGNCRFVGAYNSGIISRFTKGLFVHGSLFDYPDKYGIRCPSSIKLSIPIRISRNIFNLNGTNTLAGVYVERPPGGPSVFSTLISDNTLSMTGGHQKKDIIMIDVQGKTNALDVVEISQNTLLSTVNWYKISGIRVTGKGENYRIINQNDLTWQPTATPIYTGISSRGIIASELMGGNHLIEDNDIVSTLNGSNSFMRAGIHLENNPFAVLVCDNRPEDIYRGIYCHGNLANTAMKKNEIGDAVYGLYCSSTSVMPPQDRFENRWVGSTYVTRGAEYEGGSPSFKIYYDPSSTIPDDKPNTVFPTTDWFDQETGSNSTCGLALGLTHQENELIDGTLQPENTAANWDARRMLLYKLMRYPEIGENDLDADDYLDTEAIAASSPWQFARAEWLFDQAYTLSSGDQADIDDMLAACQLWSDSLIILDDEQAQDTTTFDTTIANKRAYAFLQLAVAADSLEQLRTEADVAILAALEMALDTIAALPDTVVYEENLRDILKIAGSEARGDSLTESEFGTLRAIAAQCPETGGISVRRAPIWLEHEEGLAYSDKDWAENCVESRPTSIKNLEAPFVVRIIPNPANDQVRLVFPENTPGQWRVTDMTGQIIREGEAAGTSVSFGTMDVPSGVYFLTCQLASGSVTITKFIINH